MMLVLMVPFGVAGLLALISPLAFVSSRPHRAAWVLTVGAIVAALSTTGALALVAWPLVARLGLVAHIGEWSSGDVGRHTDVPVVASVIALGLLCVVAARVARFGGRLVAQIRELGTTHRALAGQPLAGHPLGPVLVVSDRRPLAYAAPAITARGGRAVISTGLIEVLDAEEQVAVLAHERAHLQHRHHLFTFLLDAAVVLDPFLSSVAKHARFQLERWADETAAAATHPDVLASALAKAALAQLAHGRLVAAPLTLQAVQSGVTERVRALIGDGAPRQRIGLLHLVVVAAAAGVLAVAWAAHDMDGIFDALRRLR
ncbi:MAG: peptidase Ste24p [Ilumatobacteraceae bacterium]|nr:peptidase Ste24p [Ilumatobacteraceae bacterium]